MKWVIGLLLLGGCVQRKINETPKVPAIKYYTTDTFPSNINEGCRLPMN